VEELSLEQLVHHYSGLERAVAEELGGLEQKASAQDSFGSAALSHPIISGSAVGFVSLIAQNALPFSHRLYLFGEDTAGALTPLALGFGAYVLLSVGRDYLLKKREKIKAQVKNLPNKIRHVYYNNPVLSGLAATGAFLTEIAYFSPETFRTSPAGMFLFSSACYLIGHVSSIAAKRAERLRKGFERFKMLRPKNKPLTEIAEKCYNNLLWEKPWIRAALVAVYSLTTDYQVLMDKAPDPNIPFLLGILAIPAAAKGAAVYVGNVLGSNMFHTNNLYIMKNMVLSRISEEHKNYRDAVKYQQRLLEVSPSKKFEFENRMRLAGLYLKLGLFLDSLDEYGMAIRTGYKPKPKEAKPKALERVKEVHSLYSLLGEGIDYFRNGMFKEAELFFIRAIKLDPSEELPHLFYSCLLDADGRKEESTSELRIFERIAISKGNFSGVPECRNQVLIYKG